MRQGPYYCCATEVQVVAEPSCLQTADTLTFNYICSALSTGHMTLYQFTCSFSRRASSSVTSVTSITSTSTVRDDSRSGWTAPRRREKIEAGRLNWGCGGLACLALTRLADSTATLTTPLLLCAGAFPMNAEARQVEQEATARSLRTTTIVYRVLQPQVLSTLRLASCVRGEKLAGITERRYDLVSFVRPPWLHRLHRSPSPQRWPAILVGSGDWMDPINVPDAIGWRCARCGHAVSVVIISPWPQPMLQPRLYNRNNRNNQHQSFVRLTRIERREPRRQRRSVTSLLMFRII